MFSPLEKGTRVQVRPTGDTAIVVDYIPMDETAGRSGRYLLTSDRDGAAPVYSVPENRVKEII